MKNIFTLKNKKGIFVGSSGFIGTYLCSKFFDMGARVHLFDKRQITSKSRKKAASFFLGDVNNRSQVSFFLKRVLKIEKRLDFLVYAPTVSPRAKFFKRTKYELNTTYEANVLGNINFLLEIFNLKKNQIGNTGLRIVNFSSIYGFISPNPSNYEGLDWCNSEIYGASKAGVIQLTKYFSTFGGKRNILVNSISPGGLWNPFQPQDKQFVQKYISFTPLGRMGSVTDILGPVTFLLSQANTYITGHNLVVDGGYTII